MKAINQQTGAFVEISRQLPPNGDPNFKLFVIRGSPQQIDHAKQLIEEKIEVRSWVLVKVPCLLGLLTAAVTFSLRVPSAQLDQALGDQALLDPWGLSTLDPSTRGLQGHPHSEYSLAPGLCLVLWGLEKEGQALSNWAVCSPV